MFVSGFDPKRIIIKEERIILLIWIRSKQLDYIVYKQIDMSSYSNYFNSIAINGRFNSM